MSDNFLAALPFEDIPWDDFPMDDLDAPLISGPPVVKPSPKRQPTVEEWNMMRPRIKELWIDQNKTFEKVQEALTVEFNFEPTKRQFTAKATRWGLKKNATKKERAEIVEKLAVAGECDEVPEIGQFRINGNKLARWKRETKEFVQQEVFTTQDADVDEKSEVPIAGDDDGANIWQCGRENVDIDLDETHDIPSPGVDDDSADIWRSWGENPCINFDEILEIPSVETNCENGIVDLQQPVFKVAPHVDENMDVDDMANGNLDQVEGLDDVEEISRAQFFKEPEQMEAEDGLRRLNETLNQPEFRIGLEDGTKKFWDAADIPGSPRLSRLMAALTIGAKHISEMEPMSLDDPGINGKGYITQVEICNLTKRDRIIERQCEEFADTDASRVVVRSKKRERRPTVLPSYLRHILRVRQPQHPPSPLNKIDPFPRFIDLDDETNSQGLPQLRTPPLQQQKLDCEARLKKLEQLLPANSLRLAEQREALGDIYWQLGQYNAAENLYQQTLTTKAIVLGEDHFDTLSSALNIIESLVYKGRYSEAYKLHQSLHHRILRLSRPGSSLAINSTKIMAKVQHSLGNYADSQNGKREILQICLIKFGLRAIPTWYALRELAIGLQATTEYIQSEYLFSTAQQLRYEIANLPDQKVSANMSRLAEVLVSRGRYEDSSSLARMAMNMAQRQFGETDLYTLQCSKVFGRCLRLQGKFDESEGILRDVVAMETSLYGPDNVYTLYTMSELAQTLVELKRWDEAATVFEHVYLGRVKIYGINHHKTMIPWDWLIYCCQQPELGLDNTTINAKMDALRNKAMEAIREKEEMDDFESDDEESNEESDQEDEPQQAKKVRISSPETFE